MSVDMASPKVGKASASRTISLLGMMNGELKEKIENLFSVFPHVNLITIRDTLVTCKGDVSEACDVLADSRGNFSFEQPSSSSNKSTILSAEAKEDSHMSGITPHGEKETIQLLQEMCPFQAISKIRLMLSTCNGDVAAAALLLTETSPIHNGKDSNFPENPRHVQEIFEAQSRSNDLVQKSQNGPSTAPLKLRHRYPGGVIPPFRVSTRRKLQNVVIKSGTIKNESESSDDLISTTSNNEELIERAAGGEQSLEEKVAALQAILPRARENRIKSILQIEENMDDAFAALDHEFGPLIPDEDIPMDDEDDEKTYESSGDDELPRSQKLSRGKGRKLVPVPGYSRLKKRPGSSNERAVKRPRQSADSEDAGEDLEPAAEWVKKYFSQSSGFSIILDEGVYPNRIPKAILDNFKCSRDQFEANVTETLSGASITFRNVRAGILDLAVQYSACKRFKLTPAQRSNISREITTVLDLAVLASNLGLRGSESDLTVYLKNVLLRNRYGLEGQHIRTAYTLEEGHPIRRLFIQAVARSWAEFHHNRQDDDESFDGSISEIESTDLNEAQRRAWRTPKWEYNSEYCGMKDFRIDILEEFGKMWQRMDRVETKLKRIAPYRIFLLDPLTKERFLL